MKLWRFILKMYVFYFTFSIPVYSQNFIEVNNSIIKPSELGYTSWIDINNDKFMDLFITGFNLNSTDFSSSLIYLNNGSGGFITSNITNIPRVIYGNHDWGDFNNDGYADLVMSGTTSGYPEDGICRVYINNMNSGFDLLPVNLPGVVSSETVWFDYNNDGWSDLIIIGIGTHNNSLVKIFTNQEGKTLIENTQQLSVIAGGRTNLGTSSALAEDFDNDGDIDLIVAQCSSGGFSIDLYENINSVFTKRKTNLPQMSNATLTTADFNNDGNLDVVINGINVNETSNTYSTLADFHVLIGDGTLNFILLAKFESRGSYWGSISAGDLNNDGMADILINGTGNGYAKTQVFLNKDGKDFILNNQSLKGTLLGQAALGDYDYDGDLDMLVIGSEDGSGSSAQARMYRNDVAKKNNKPSTPSGLHVDVLNGVVTLSWDRSTDPETNSKSLSYNIKITSLDGRKTSSYLCDNMGTRLVDQLGNSGLRNFYQIKSEMSTFTWQVQALDAAFYESNFSPIQSACVSPQPLVNYKNQYLCGDSVKMIASGDHIEWYNNEALTNKVFNGNIFQVKATGDQVFYVIDRVPGCFNTSAKVQFRVVLSDGPQLDYKSHYCYKEGVTLSATGDSVNWFDDESLLHLVNTGKDYMINAESDKKFYVVHYPYGCQSNPSIMYFTVSEPLRYSLLLNGKHQKDTVALNRCFQPENFLFTVDTNYPNVKWENETENNVLYTIKETDNYTVHISDDHLCGFIKKIRVSIFDSNEVKIANIVTANGDGKNDALLLDPLLPNVKLHIMNRDGKQIYYSSTYHNDFYGEDLSAGVYYYYAIVGTCQPRKGSFSFVR